METQQHQQTQNVTPLWKTRTCKFFKVGKCTKGETCQYAHDEDELRPSPDFTMSSICPRISRAGGVCNDPNCRYAHDIRELRPIPDQLKTKTCKFFAANGKCMLGELCRFAHDDRASKAPMVANAATPNCIPRSVDRRTVPHTNLSPDNLEEEAKTQTDRTSSRNFHQQNGLQDSAMLSVSRTSSGDLHQQNGLQDTAMLSACGESPEMQEKAPMVANAATPNCPRSLRGRTKRRTNLSLGNWEEEANTATPNCTGPCPRSLRRRIANLPLSCENLPPGNWEEEAKTLANMTASRDFHQQNGWQDTAILNVSGVLPTKQEKAPMVAKCVPTCTGPCPCSLMVANTATPNCIGLCANLPPGKLSDNWEEEAKTLANMTQSRYPCQSPDPCKAAIQASGMVSSPGMVSSNTSSNYVSNVGFVKRYPCQSQNGSRSWPLAQPDMVMKIKEGPPSQEKLMLCIRDWLTAMFLERKQDSPLSSASTSINTSILKKTPKISSSGDLPLPGSDPGHLGKWHLGLSLPEFPLFNFGGWEFDVQNTFITIKEHKLQPRRRSRSCAL